MSHQQTMFPGHSIDDKFNEFSRLGLPLPDRRRLVLRRVRCGRAQPLEGDNTDRGRHDRAPSFVTLGSSHAACPCCPTSYIKERLGGQRCNQVESVAFVAGRRHPMNDYCSTLRVGLQARPEPGGIKRFSVPGSLTFHPPCSDLQSVCRELHPRTRWPYRSG